MGLPHDCGSPVFEMTDFDLIPPPVCARRRRISERNRRIAAALSAEMVAELCTASL